MTPHPSERELLVTLLAHRRGVISRADLMVALEVWIGEGRRRSLLGILLERGLIDPPALPAIEAAVDRGDSDAEALARGLDHIDPADPSSVAASLDVVVADSVQPTTADPTALTRALDPRDEEVTRAGELPRAFEDLDAPEGDPTGRYRIVRPLARGGLGEVYVARDEEVGRTVALKVMRREVLTHEGLRERFVRESEINGNLEHPGIIPVYGKGEYEDGRPYYAMRLVEGGTLQQAIEKFHADAKSLKPHDWAAAARPLLRRFLVICEAIAYAHGRGVLHRDLKPSNVLLGPYGETLIIDWGLAKLHRRGDDYGDAIPVPADPSSVDSVASSQLLLHSGSASLPTQAGQTLGSPPFMSPEQVRGEQEAVGEASDVYGLGATLYNLLTGRPPVSGLPVKETLRRVREGRIDPVHTVEPRVPPALAAICARAMRLDPPDRYPTARALAEDLEHWLADEPVAAHRDAWTTRLARWARRHKPAVAGALGLVAAGLLGLAVNNLLIGRERDIARTAKVRAELAEAKTAIALGDSIEAQVLARDHLRDGMELVGQFVDLGDRQLLARLSTDSRREFLERAVEFTRRFREREPEDHEVRQAAADVERRLANLARLEGQIETAIGLLSDAVGELEGLPATPQQLEALARTRNDLGDALALAGRLGDAEAEFRRAQADADRLTARIGNHPAARRARARALDRLGSFANLRGNLGDAEGSLKAALEALEPLASTDPTLVRQAFDRETIQPLYDDLDVVGTSARLAETLADAGRAEDAARLFETAMERMARLDRAFGAGTSRDVDFHSAWLAVQDARARLDRGVAGGVDAALDAAIQRLEVVEAEDPGQPHVLRARAEARLERARASLAEGQAADAASHATAAIGLFHELILPDPDLPLLRADALRVRAQALRDVPDQRDNARIDLTRGAEELERAAAAGVRPPRAARLSEELRRLLGALAP